MRRLGSSLVLALCVLGCGEPLEFADWTIPVPEGVEVHEHVAVSAERRARNRIEVVEELVLGSPGRRMPPTPNDPQQAFYRPRAVVPDADGNIYVLDQGNHISRSAPTSGSRQSPPTSAPPASTTA